MALFKRISTGDRILENIQDAISLAFQRLENSIGLGNLIDVTTAVSTDIIVNHRLGKRATGYRIEESDADVRVWTSSTENTHPKHQIILRASGSANIKLYIY